jgi:hypothetical protein
METDPKVIRSRYVNYNSALINPWQAGADEADVVILNLFPDVSLIAQKERVEKREVGSYTWFGKIKDMPLSSVVLTVVKGVLTGHINTGRKVYEITRIEEDVYVIKEIDQSLFPEETTPLEPMIIEDAAPSVQADDNGDFIDVLVVYTDDARVEAGGTSNILSQIQTAIDESNQSFRNSGVWRRYRLAKAVEATYTETGNMNTDLDCITNPSDGCLDWIHTTRDTIGADVVSFWVSVGGGYGSCGLGWMMSTVSTSFSSYAFSVVRRDCATGYYSFGHEIGHNSGARHDCYVDSTLGSPYDYNHGYVYVSGQWRTIMAYNTECADNGVYCTRIQYWSNPNVNYNSQPTGTPSNPGSCTADNESTLDNTDSTVAQFKISKLTLMGVLRNGRWYIDRSGNKSWDGCSEERGCFIFGTSGDYPAIGDWNGDGDDDLGVFRNGKWYLDANDSEVWGGCSTDICATFGTTGDYPVVGDFDGDGDDDIGVFRNGKWYIDKNDNNYWDGCTIDRCYTFGTAGDIPVVGSECWDGACTHDAIGVFRNGKWYLDEDGDFFWDGCTTDGCYIFGTSGDYPAIGDWNGDGDDDLGVFRNGKWYLDANDSEVWGGCSTDICAVFGTAGDKVAIGIW